MPVSLLTNAQRSSTVQYRGAKIKSLNKFNQHNNLPCSGVAIDCTGCAMYKTPGDQRDPLRSEGLLAIRGATDRV